MSLCYRIDPTNSNYYYLIHVLVFSRAMGLKKLGAGKCNFPAESCKLPTANLYLKVSRTFILNFHIVCAEK